MADSPYPDIPESEAVHSFEHRLDAEWVALNAIREMLGIAFKGKVSPTYLQSLQVGRRIAAKIFDSESSLLGRNREPQLVQEYRQKADAVSQIRGRIVEPLEVLDEDIELQQRLVRTTGDKILIQRRLENLEDIRVYFLPKSYTENQIIIRDLYKADRGLPIPPIEGDTFRDFKVSDDRGMRIRMLHPDPVEHAIGADLIYEHYWDKRHVARIALIQYKIWNGKALYLSQASNVEDQMNKMRNIFCKRDLCSAFEGTSRTGAYRLPYCSVFLRPTDKIQDPDVRLISSGLHIPICVAFKKLEDTARGGKKIESRMIRSESVSHKVFEEMFNANLLGSKWLTYEELAELYRSHGVFDVNQRIVLHAQEFGIN